MLREKIKIHRVKNEYFILLVGNLFVSASKTFRPFFCSRNASWTFRKSVFSSGVSIFYHSFALDSKVYNTNLIMSGRNESKCDFSSRTAYYLPNYCSRRVENRMVLSYLREYSSFLVSFRTTKETKNQRRMFLIVATKVLLTKRIVDFFSLREEEG